MGSRTLKQLAKNDLILPVEIGEADKALYQPGVLATVSDGGQLWGYPHAFSTKALYMNCGLVEEAGEACEAPQTWDDLYALAKAINDKTDAAGIGLAAKDFDNTMHQFLNYLYLKNLFNDGAIGMYINGPWGRGQHNEEINQKIVPIPAGPSGEQGTILITDSLAVFKGSGHEELAMQLAQKLSSGESQYDLDQSWGLTPILQYEKAGVDAPYYVDDPFWEVYVAGISKGGPEPLVTDFKSLQSVFTNMIQGIVLKDDTAENLVAIAAEELAEIK